MCMRVAGSLFTLLLLLFAGACSVKEEPAPSIQEPQAGDESVSSPEAPPPGTMTTVSIEPVQLARINLITGGDFAGHWTGEGDPHGFGGPDRGRGFSSIGVERTRLDSFKVRQTWEKGVDGGESIFNLFHTAVKQLKPETRYRFSCSAKNLSNGSIRVTAWQVIDIGSPKQKVERISWELVTIPPSEDFKEYSGEFTTLPREGFTVVLSASARNDVTTFPATVTWGYWRLIEARP